MIDIRRIKEDPSKVKDGFRAKEVNCDEQVDRILELDAQRRAMIAETEAMKAEQNKVSKQIPMLKKNGEDVAPVFARMGELKASIAANDEKLRDVEAEYRTLMLSLPNLPDEDLLPGGKENNEPLRYIGDKCSFDFEPKHHVDLCVGLGLIDYERGVKLAGAGNWMYTGMASCKNSGWLELCPCGMIHPNVLKAGGIDTEKYTGFAFGLGLTRLAMMRYGIKDIRDLNSGDLRSLSQFVSE